MDASVRLKYLGLYGEVHELNFEEDCFLQILLDCILAQRKPMSKLKSLYSGLGNVIWYNEKLHVKWACTLHYAGGVCAAIDNFLTAELAKCYNDYYCCTKEEVVRKWLERDMEKRGWRHTTWENAEIKKWPEFVNTAHLWGEK